ncbi:MAG: succinylglutamate desuccinylase/aspartoacylase family protein [Opitutaceae bacterium]|nr:succinylglutamate desuccinylase/aspartoacylase family protein [Opitutaceae bacterium]
MAASSLPKGLDFSQLPAGFHTLRFSTRGAGFTAFVWRGGPGPVLVVNGATHGDEYEGPTVLRQWTETWRPKDLNGTVVFIPVLNEAAFFAGQRCHPDDGGNLARSFPGRARGRVSERLAWLFDTQVLSQTQHYVDLHRAGASYQLLPWVGYVTQSGKLEKTQRAMSAAFDRFWCWSGPFLPGRTLSAAFARGVAAIYVECQGAGGVDAGDAAALDQGLHHVLVQLGYLPSRRPLRLRKQVERVTRDVDEAHLQVHHPAPHDGLFVPTITLAASIRRGQVVGVVHPLTGTGVTVVKAESTGRVVLLRRQRSVKKGDALATLAPI